MTDSSHPSPGVDALLAEADWVKRLARSLLRDEGAAEDLSQDVLHDAIRRPPELEGKRLRGWLLAVTRRKASRRWHRQSSRAVVEAEAATPEAQDGTAASERIELHVELAREIQALGPDDRAILVAHYFEGVTQRELALRLGLPASTLRVRMSRARERLRQRLDRSPRGEEGWRAALSLLAGLPRLPATPPDASPRSSDVPSLAATGAPLPLAIMTAKLLLPTALIALTALAGLRFLGDGSPSDAALERSGTTIARVSPSEAEPGSRPRAAPQPGTVERTAATALAAAESAATWRRTIRLVTSEGGTPNGARVAWIGARGTLEPLTLDASGRATLSDRGPGIVFAYGPGRMGRAVHLDGSAEGADKGPGEHRIELRPVGTIRLRFTVDGVAPEGPIALRVSRYASDLGLPVRSEVSADDVERALGLAPLPPVVASDALGVLTLVRSWERSELRMSVPAAYVVRGRKEYVPATGRQTVRVDVENPPQVVDLARLPAITGRLVWSDDGTPVEGWMEVLKTNEEGYMIDGLRWEYLSADGRFALPGLGSPEDLDPALLDRPDALADWEVAHTIRLTVSQIARHFEHRIAVHGLELPADVGDIVVERLPTLEVFVRGTRSDASDPAPVAATLRGSARTVRTDGNGRAEVALTPGDSLGVLATGYRYQSIPITAAILEQNAPLRVELERAPLLTIVGPVIDSPTCRPRLQLRFDRTPFGTADLDDEGLGSPFDLGLHKTLRGRNHVIGGEWSHRTPGAPGSIELELPRDNGTVQIGDLEPGTTFDAELVDGLGHVLMAKGVALEDADVAVDLSDGWRERAYSLRVRARWANGDPVDAGTVRLRGEAGIGKSFPFEGGAMCIEPLAAATYRVTVGADGASDTVVEALELRELAEGATPRERVLDVTLRPE